MHLVLRRKQIVARFFFLRSLSLSLPLVRVCVHEIGNAIEYV